jgi:DNA-binding NarL/FixJ family response regulator
MTTKPFIPYTPREIDRRILRLLSDGETITDIASGWGTTYGSIKNRLWRMRRAAEVDTVTHLVAEAMRRDWIE